MADRNDLLDIFIRRAGLPELEGTPQEIAEAEKIRRDRVVDFLQMLPDPEFYTPSPWNPSVTLAYVASAMREPYAAKWIETKNLYFWEWVAKHHGLEANWDELYEEED